LATRKPDEGYVSDTMRQELKSALENSWQESLLERAQISPHSAVPPLDELLSATTWMCGARPHLAPKSDIASAGNANARSQVTLRPGVSSG
jgi:hypothetical protein